MGKHLTRAGLFALLASAMDASCDPMGRTGLPVPGEGGASSSAASSQASTSASKSASASVSTSSSQASSSVASSGSAGGGVPTPRRPFLVGASLRVAETRPSLAWSAPLAPPTNLADAAATRALLGDAWLRDAREEHASIAAFARFSMQLLALGAPPSMIRESQRASLDEIRHAEACFSLARRYRDDARGPVGLDLEGALGPWSLLDVVAMTAEEGAVGETLGASLAAEQARVCREPAVKRVLERIARDEARHARLAWGFVAWAVSCGGREARDVAAATIARAGRASLALPLRSYDGIDIDLLHAHGRLTCLESREVTRATLEEVVWPARDRLLEAATARSDARA